MPPLSGPQQQPEDADQAIVSTPYGRGLVVRSRKSDGIKEVSLLELESERCFASRSSPASSRNREGALDGGGRGRTPFMMYTPVDYPSVAARVGDDVVCQYGRGRVTKISRVACKGKEPVLKYSIAITSWRLGGRSTAICHVTSPPPRVVRKHTLREMDAHERIDHAKSEKAKATSYFSEKKNYQAALEKYAEAVDAVRNVQHDYTSTNEVRADLIVVMVTCSNNAATCCVKLEKWPEASKFAKNALILLDALYGKRGKKIHTILKKEGTIDAKLFGEWRVKSYLVVARSCIEEGEVSDALAVLKKARTVAMGYIDEISAKQQTCTKEEKASLKSLTSQVKEIRRLSSICLEKKKATKQMEKKRAKAMFGGNKENTPPVEANKEKDMQPPQSKEKGDNTAGENGIKPTSRQEEKTIPYQRKSSLNTKKDGRPSMEKSVSFSEKPPEVKEFESTDEESPWYSEHQEALIMLGIAGFSAVALMALRRAFR
ncbi:hypothetical protein ACHAXT_009196 [Thalassiosira profunda]